MKDTIKNFIEETTYGDKSLINDDTLIFKEGIFDSMGFISLISFLEEKFNVKTQDEDLVEENFESINAIVSFIEKKSTKAA